RVRAARAAGALPRGLRAGPRDRRADRARARRHHHHRGPDAVGRGSAPRGVHRPGADLRRAHVRRLARLRAADGAARMSFRHIVLVVLLVAGVGLEAVCCLGLIVMRDVYDRLHYAAPGAFGAGLIAIAVVVQESFSLIGNKALAAAAVLVLTGPVLVHVTARTARIRDHGDWRPQRD